MGILSEIFAELNQALNQTQSQQSRPKTQSNTYGMADPFANNMQKTTVKKTKSSATNAPKNVPISQQKTALELHSHKHPARAGSRMENRPSYAGSLGVVNDEGCSEHAGERYISQSKPMVSANTISVADMRKAVIMSEILGKPKSKR